MNILAIDVGSYSVKFLQFKQERKQLFLIKAHEVIIDEAKEKWSSELDLHPLQAEIVKNFLGEDLESKVIMQIPSEYITSRYFTLPSAHKRKVDMMIPFQLDENLPFQTFEAHYITHLTKRANSTSALVNIAKLDEFDRFYSHYSSREALPSILTSELAIIQSYAAYRDLKNPTIILDIGHETTKCYVIREGEVVSNHISHTAGKVLDDVIAQTYQIPEKEALQYKHENCFFLTEAQYQEVSQDQQEFAKLMKQAIWPLILDVKRWLLGFRVKYGTPIEFVYLTGGTSQINNINNFFTQTLATRVESLEITHAIANQEELLGKKQAHYFLVQMMADTQHSKQKPGNFLFGPYSGSREGYLPLHSASFIGVRVLIFCLIYSAFLLGEGFILKKKKNQIYRKVSKSIKLKKYGIPKSRQRYLKRRPERILKLLKKKAHQVSQEVKTVQAAARINAIAPLALISREISAVPGVQMKRFTSDGKFVRAEFVGDKSETLNKLEKNIKSSSLPNLEVEKSKKGLAFTLMVE